MNKAADENVCEKTGVKVEVDVVAVSKGFTPKGRPDCLSVLVVLLADIRLAEAAIPVLAIRFCFRGMPVGDVVGIFIDGNDDAG